MTWGPYRSRIPYVDPDNPISYGRDDISGLPIMHDDMVQVMEFFGSQIQWTGYMTHKDKVDIPQPQLAPAYIRPQPLPVDNIRILSRTYTPPIPTGLTVLSTTTNSATLQWNSVQVATSYEIEWTAGGPPNLIKGIAVTTGLTQTYVLDSLPPSGIVWIAVATTYPECTSAFSDPIIAYTLP